MLNRFKGKPNLFVNYVGENWRGLERRGEDAFHFRLRGGIQCWSVQMEATHCPGFN